MVEEDQKKSHSLQEAASPRRSTLITVILTVFLAIAIFVLGVYVGARNGLDITLGFPVASSEPTGRPNQETTELAKRIAEVDSIFTRESLSPQSLDAATEGAINGLLISTGDEYAYYYDEEQYAAFKDLSSGQFGGIGVVLADYQGQAYLVRVYSGTPAESAGMQAGDFIVAINGDRSKVWSYEAVANAVKGEAGKQVEITWRRPSSKEDPGGSEYTAAITTAEISYPNVEYILADEIGLISIAQFNEKTTEEVTKAISSLDQAGAQGYVLDLRGNPGGLLNQAVNVTSLFLQSGTVVEVVSRTSGTSREAASGNHVTDKPLAVLVNGDSASAAEIVAAALQDHERALIVGGRTFGKGTVQTVKDLSFGGGLKFTIATYRSPDGNVIDKLGVTPDLILENMATEAAVSRSDIATWRDDAQVMSAVDLVRNQIAVGSVNVEGLTNPPGSEKVEQPAQSSTATTQTANN